MKMTDYEGGVGDQGFTDDDRVLEWEIGLPSADDLTSLSQPPQPNSHDAMNIKT